MKLNRKEAVDVIENFLDGTGELWDDFTCIPIENNRELDGVGLFCSRLPEIYPPEKAGQYCNERGLEVLRAILTWLRKKDS